MRLFKSVLVRTSIRIEVGASDGCSLFQAISNPTQSSLDYDLSVSGDWLSPTPALYTRKGWVRFNVVWWGAVSMSLAPLTELLLPMVVISMFRRNGAMIFRVNKHHIVNFVRPAFAERNHVMNLPALGFFNAVSV